MGSQVCHNFQMTLRRYFDIFLRYVDIILRYVDILIFFSKPHLDIECQVLLAASSCVHSFNKRMRIENEDNDEDDDGDDDELSL